MILIHPEKISRTSSWRQHLIWQFLPPACRKCKILLSGEELKNRASPFLCTSCLESLAWTNQEYSCFQCGNPTVEPHRLRCPQCLEQTWFFDQVCSAFAYEGEIKDWIHQLKFASKEQLAPLLGCVFALSVQTNASFSGVDAVIPIPLHINRLRHRGFNQALLLAHYFSQHFFSTQYLKPQWLKRIRATPPQAQLSFNERLHNLEHAFEASSSVRNKRILLIDDVMTTGATLNAAAFALKKSGVHSVSVCVLARRCYEPKHEADEASS